MKLLVEVLIHRHQASEDIILNAVLQSAGEVASGEAAAEAEYFHADPSTEYSSFSFNIPTQLLASLRH